jgi:hypothetical protein
MKLIDELIANLSGEKPNLTDALMKTKVLLHRLGRKDLAEWVNVELNGYPEGTQVPKYRVIHTMITGVVTNMAYRHKSYPLPTLHLEEKIRKRYENLEMRESITVLEGLNANDKGGLRRPIPPEFNRFFDEAFTGGYHVERAWCEIGFGQLGQILTQVRSRLLDFVLDLSEKVDDEMTEDEVKRLGQSPETASMFNHAIFGDNVTILVGNHSTQTVANQITRGDFEALKTFLLHHNVQPADIENLRLAIKADENTEDVQGKQFGSKVRTWMKKMLAKAVENSWQIELGIASNLLTEALKAYYGW